MDVRSAPLLPAAGALVSGAALAFRMTPAEIPLRFPLLLLLLAVPLALRSRAGVLVSIFAFGALWTLAIADPPASLRPRWDPGRPLTLELRPLEPWRRSEWGGWMTAARVDLLRQGAVVLRPGLEILISLPEGKEPSPPGSRLRLTGYLRRSAGFANARPVPPGPWRLTVKSWRHVEVLAPPGPLDRLSHRLRRLLESGLEEAGGGGPDRPGAALTRALVLGDASGMSPRVVRGLRRSGLGHLLALSGLHLGLLAGLAWLAGAWLPQRGRLALVLVAAVGYLLVAGPRPSLLRAAVMVAAAVAAVALKRPPSPANALGLAVLGMVTARPARVEELGFQLTVAATAGVLLLAPRLAQRWGGGAGGGPPPRRFSLRFRLLSGLAVTVAAQLATLPWALPAFHGVSPLAPLLNLLAVPWTALALAACLAWLAAAVGLPAAAAAASPLLDAVAAPFAWPAAAPALPWWFLPLPASSAQAALLAAGLGVLLWGPRSPGPGGWGLLAAAGLIGLVAFHLLPPPSAAGEPRLCLIDVGQGDAILLVDEGRAMLVDGGGWRGRGGLGGRVLLPALLGEGVRRLDALVMTHPDTDHCAGLVEIGSYLPVAEVWMPPGWEDDPCAAELRRTPGARLRQLTAGGRGRLGRWRWWALHPSAGETTGRNQRSLVLLARVGRDGPRVLLTGDLDGATEARLAARVPELLAARVLKVAHHGSQSSSTASFLAAVAPRLALISAGRGNPYGHPAAATLDRLRRRGVRVLSTHRDGLVRLTFHDGSTLRIELPGSPR